MEMLLMQDGFLARFLRVETDASSNTRSHGMPIGDATVRGAAIRFRFEGSDGAISRGADEAEGKVNYLIGNDRNAWVRGARRFRAVQYQHLLPGVDATFHDANGSLKYDLEVAAGADVSKISIVCEGADAMAIDADGALVVSTAAGEFRQPKPKTFEYLQNGGTAPVEASWRLLGIGRAGFSVASRDPGRALCIDPGLAYGTFIGGSGIEAVQGIAVDASGNAYITGLTSSANFPVKTGAISTNSSGNFDAFVMKIKPDGSDYIFSTYVGGSGSDQGVGIAIDSTFNVYICGSTLSINYPTSAAAADKTWSFGTSFGDAFVTKIRNDGGDVLASTYLGGSGEEIALQIGLDSSLNVYVAGWTRSGTLDFPTENGFQTTFGGVNNNDLGDAFLTKFSPTLSSRLYSTYLGGTGSDGAAGLVVDPTLGSGKAYICGIARSGFPTKGVVGSPALKSSISTSGDAFVACFDTANSGANSLVFSGFLGGAGIDSALGIARDATGAIYATGYTESSDFPVLAGSYKTTYNSLNGAPGDGWVAKLNSTGTQFGYSTFLGGLGQDAATAIAVDSTGAAYVSGRTFSLNFPKVVSGFDSTYNGKLDGFVAKLNPAGTALAMASYIGGVNDDNVIAIALGSANDVFIAGATTSSFIASGSGFDTSLAAQDGFVMRLDFSPVPAICLDTEAALVVSHTLGNANNDVAARTVMNCGSLDSVLNWTVVESPDAPWLLEAPPSGAINAGAAGDSVSLTLDPTGLAAGAYKTTLQFKNGSNINDIKNVAITYIVENGIVVPFVAGDTLSGAVDFESESDLGSFSAVKGEKLKVAVTTTSGNLKPAVALQDGLGNTLKTYNLANSTKAITKTFTIPADGNYRLKISGQGATTGSYSIATSLTLPKDAKASTKKNKAPTVGGLPIDCKVRLLAGATLNVTVQPMTTLGATLGISLLDAQNNVIDVSAQTQPFGTGGLQLAAVPIAAAGQYIVRVSGPSTKKEKVTIAIAPSQPVGGAPISLQ